MSETELGFVHRYEPPVGGAARTLLLLHGTGGDENDLLDLGRMLAPAAGLLSLRGNVSERGMPRFFRRLAEGVFDEEDLRFRTGELADFVPQAAARYGFDAGQVTAVGFSNGANIAASVLLLRPGVLSAAVLFAAMVPFVPETLPKLNGTPVFIGAGRTDPIAPPENTARLAAMLHSAGANVELVWHSGGHNLTREEVDAARHWLE